MQTRTTQTKIESAARPLLQVSGLKKSYKRGTEVLHGIDFSVRSGEIFGLIGPDGAGKTTLMQILAGIVDFDEGQVSIAGKEAHKAHSVTGYIPQHFSLYPDLSIDENLRYIAGLHDVSAEDFERRRADFLERTGLSRFADRLAKQLSGGMKQKLSLCCALIIHPKVLLLDEPTAGVDPLSRREFWEIVKEFCNEGTAVVAATAYFDEAEICDRVGLITEGRIEKSGSPLQLKKSFAAKRIELASKDPDALEQALRKEIQRSGAKEIIDYYSLGSRLDVITSDLQEAGARLKAIVQKEGLPLSSARGVELSMENVYFLHMLQKGEKLNPPSAMPRNELSPAQATSRQNKPNSAIEAKNLRKNFGNFQAVHDLNLSVNYGEIYGLLGANGAGKTTTIQMLCGLHNPSSGQVLLAGKEQTSALNSERDSREVRRKFGYMSQKFSLYSDLTVIENLDFYGTVYGVSHKLRKEKIDWVIDACGLHGQENELIGNLPGGWRQRVAFGASVMHEPDILFLDEPTSGVDPIARRELWYMIRELAKQGTAILVTTHYMDEAEFCNKLGLMVDGRLIVEDSPEHLKANAKTESMEDAFIAHVRKARVNQRSSEEGS